MRQEQEKRLRELEEIYMSKKENSQVGRIIRERMGHHATETRTHESDSPRGEDFERAKNDDSQDVAPVKPKKSVKIADGKENKNDVNDEPTRASRAKPTTVISTSRSPSRGRSG